MVKTSRTFGGELIPPQPLRSYLPGLTERVERDPGGSPAPGVCKGNLLRLSMRGAGWRLRRGAAASLSFLLDLLGGKRTWVELEGLGFAC